MTITVKKNLGSSWYTPESEEGNEKPARFKLKELNREQMDDSLVGARMDDNKRIHLSPPGTIAILKHGIEAWEEFDDDEGEKIDCLQANHCRLPWDLGKELAAEILNQSMLDGHEDRSGN